MSSALRVIGTHGNFWSVAPAFAESAMDFLAGVQYDTYIQEAKETLRTKTEAVALLTEDMSRSKARTGSSFTDIASKDGIVTVELNGVITEAVSSWRDDGISTQALSAFLGEIDNDVTNNQATPVKLLAIIINTPGGILIPAMNVGEQLSALASKIPVLVYAETLLFSAGVSLVAGASNIYATPFIEFGGVSAVMRWTDYGRARKTQGYDSYVVSSGKDKIREEQRNEDGSLTEDAVRARQEKVDTLGTAMVDAVVKHARLSSDQKAMIEGGQTLFNEEALKSGVIDELLVTREAFMAKCLDRIKKGK